MGNKKITKIPDKKVKSLSAPTLAADGKTKITLTAEWKKNDGMFSKKSASRAESYFAKWEFTGAFSKKRKKKTKASNAVKVKGHKLVTVTEIKDSATSLKQSLNREAYYPFTLEIGKKKKTLKLKKIVFYIGGANKVGKAKKLAKKAVTILPPDNPTIGAMVVDSETKKWGVAVTIPPTKKKSGNYLERYDCLVYAWTKKKGASSWTPVKPSKTGKEKNTSGDAVVTTEDSFVWARTVADMDSYGFDDWLAVKVEAKSRGLAGICEKPPTKISYLSYPAKPSISKIECHEDGANAQQGSVIISLKSQATTEHPVDFMQLEILKNSSHKPGEKAAAAADAGWEEVRQSTGIGSTTALKDTYDNADIQPNLYTWYRVRSEHYHFTRYSDPVCAEGLFRGVGNVGIEEVRVVDDGASPTGIYVEMGFDGKASGTEVEWSQFKNAVNSNKQPDSYQQPLVRSATKTAEFNATHGTNYDYSTLFYISDLEEGGKYYISARRYNDGGTGGTQYGERAYWKKDAVTPVLFARKPYNVVLNVPDILEETATGMEVSWDFTSAIPQTKYILYGVIPATPRATNPDGTLKTTEIVLSEGETEKRVATVDAAMLKTVTFQGAVTMRVEVTCGGPYGKSANAMTKIRRKPSLKLDISQGMPNGVLTAQHSNSPNVPAVRYQLNTLSDVTLLLSIASNGCVMQHPDGDYEQMAGEVVYTGTVSPQPESAEGGWGTFNLPFCDFLDGGSYTLSVTPVANIEIAQREIQMTGATGYVRTATVEKHRVTLKGETRTVEFKVSWAHQAGLPGPMSRAVGNQSDVSASIYLDAPENWAYGDVCDVYRVTPDGTYLIASDQRFGTTVVDPFAPFSKRANLRYRLATRTADGDVLWTDVRYNLPAHGIRFDWIGSRANGVTTYHSVTLPYNTKFSDSWTKQFEKVRDLTGKATGWWNPGVDRKATLNAELIRYGDIEQKELVRELAVHSGPVFVRTPNGCAFEANVNVTGFSDDYDSLVCPVSFDAEEIDLTEAFMSPSDEE